MAYILLFSPKQFQSVVNATVPAGRRENLISV